MDIADPSTPRWIQRFSNFDRAIILLREGVELAFAPGAHPILLEALVKRFEYSWELAWKTLKDYLIYDQVTSTKITAAEAIRTAFAAGYIARGQDWMNALEARNAMSHIYSRDMFERVTIDIRDSYLGILEELHETLMTARAEWDVGDRH